MATTTNKIDAYTRFLDSRSNIFVGDTDIFAKLFGKSTGARVTLRYVARQGLGAKRAGICPNYQLLLVCTHPDLQFIAHQDLVADVQALQFLLRRHFRHHVPVIISPNEIAGDDISQAQFGVFRPLAGVVDVVSAAELRARLITLDAGLDAAPGCYKPCNRSINDVFQVWSRTYLPANSCVNDIDVLQFSGTKLFDGRMRLVELKRVACPATWGPYVTDRSNYRAQIELSAMLDLAEPHVVAYSPDADEIALHHVVTLSSARIHSRRRICPACVDLDAAEANLPAEHCISTNGARPAKLAA
jgi:hypothetical protein